MLEKYLENYVEELYSKQNTSMFNEQNGLYSRKDYYELLIPVIEMFKSHDSLSLDEMREQLFEASKIEEKITEFIYKREMAPGMVFSYGTKNYKETVIIGNKQEISLDTNGNYVPSLDKMTEDTIFDLASVTKLFTSLSILNLVKQNVISLDDEVIKYAPQFHNLKGVTIFDLMSFRIPLKTNGRVDQAKSREEAESILYNIEIDQNNNNLRPYTDMGAMVLKYVIESASGMSLYSFVDESILKKAKMVDTHVVIPKLKLDRVASTNFDGKYYKDGNFSINTTAPIGTVYDPKAQRMGQTDGILSGHAGLFSTPKDMTNLAKAIIGGQIIDDEYVEMLARNRTGKKYIQDEKEKYVQYLGFLCYSKNPILGDSELFHAMSGKAFASAGWTGTQLTVDPMNELYFFMAANRSHNRMTFIDPAQREKVKCDELGRKTIVLPDGSIKIDATRFAWERDEVVVQPALKLTIQYKMLEDLKKLENEKVEESERTRTF